LVDIVVKPCYNTFTLKHKGADMRKYTVMVMDMMDEGVMSAQAVADMCLAYMSEDDVKDMCRANDLLPEDEEDEECDGQPDEAQEWADFDPDC
jgi:hypothetical protein